MKILYSCLFPLKKARVRDFGKQFLCVTTLFPRLSCLPTFVCSHSSLSSKKLSKTGIAPLASRPENWLAAGCPPRATGFPRSSKSVRWLTGPLCKRLAAPPQAVHHPVRALFSAVPVAVPPAAVPAFRLAARVAGVSWGGRLGGCPIAHGSPPPEPGRMKRLPARLLAVTPPGRPQELSTQAPTTAATRA